MVSDPFLDAGGQILLGLSGVPSHGGHGIAHGRESAKRHASDVPWGSGHDQVGDG